MLNLFSSTETHPYPNNLALKERAAQCRHPSRPGSSSSSNVKKQNMRKAGQGTWNGRQQKVLRFSNEIVPREPWFVDRDGKNGLHKKNILVTLEEPTQQQHQQHSNGLNGSSNDFKSVALECEWQFREAKNLIEARQDDSGHRKPDTEFITICCRVIGDLSPVCGPIRRLLLGLREEFIRHIFSDFYYPAPGNSTLCQVPFFEVVDSLKVQLEDMTEQRNTFKQQLVEEVNRRRDLDQEVRTLKRQVAEKDREILDCRTKMANISSVAEQAKDNYRRVRDDHNELSRELQELNKQKMDIEKRTSHETQIYQIRLTQLSNELKKAMNELTTKNDEINRLQTLLKHQ